MKTSRFAALAAAAVLLLAQGQSVAQIYRSSYFLDNYSYSYRINPAAQVDTCWSFFGMLINDLTFSAGTNVGASDVLFERGGEYVSGFDDEVPAGEFLSRLDDYNQAWLGLNENILALGFWGHRKHFNTLEINLRGEMGAGVPKDVLDIAKEEKGGTYDISGTGLSLNTCLELAYGTSRRIGDLIVGGRVKLLTGLVGADLKFDDVKVTLDEEGETISTTKGTGHVRINQNIGEFQTDENGNVDIEDLAIEEGKIAPSGFGGAVDLGVTWLSPVKGLTVTASLLDLGLMCWNHGVYGEIATGESYDIEDLNLNDVLNIKPFDGSGTHVSALPFTFTAGAKYNFIKMLTAGALFSYSNQSFMKVADMRLGLTFHPGGAFNLSVNAGAGTYGTSFGTAISLRFPIVNFFLGADSWLYTPGYMSIPANGLMTTVNAGLTLAFRNKSR